MDVKFKGEKKEGPTPINACCSQKPKEKTKTETEKSIETIEEEERREI